MYAWSLTTKRSGRVCSTSSRRHELSLAGRSLPNQSLDLQSVFLQLASHSQRESFPGAEFVDIILRHLRHVQTHPPLCSQTLPRW